ncbi:alpha/beta hydrolase fold protein [Mycena rebaudengoi]|nr:alpha/beta hydrolase fold protein [Mycena rebaudengoi]
MATTIRMSDGANIFAKILGDGPGKPLLIDTFRVIVYDARGSGASDLQPPYTHARWVADIEELRIWAGADKFILAGASYGGTVALEYAALHCDKLAALLLRDTWSYGLGDLKRTLHNILSSPRIHADPERQRRVWTGKISTPPLLPPPADTFEGEAPAPHYATHNAAFSENQPNYDVRSKLGSITVPTLIVVGRHDVITPVEFSEEIHRGIPGSQLTIFEKSGHSPALDEPEAFQARVRKFFGSLSL